MVQKGDTMINVGGIGIWFDGGHKGEFTIYIAPRSHLIRNHYKDEILKLKGVNVDCSGAIFKAILTYVDFYSKTVGKRFLKNHEWLIKECFKEQVKGNRCMGKCYNCGTEMHPKEECYYMGVEPDWISQYIPLSYSLDSDKFVDINKAPLIPLKELDIRSSYICGVHMICKIKSIKKPIVKRNFYIQECIFYDDNTSKTINGLLKDGVADFDKWHVGDKVELMGTFTNGKLNVTSMELLEVDSSEPLIVNRNDETPGYNEWRKSIINRDHKCVCCGHDKHLEAHHLFGYKENPSLAVNESNGVALCKFCHDKYHNIYGIKNINPVDFMKFIKRFGVR